MPRVGYAQITGSRAPIPTVGCLGGIVFTVSDETVKTINNAVWSGSVRIAEHQRHNYHAATEFSGINPDKFQFEMVLASFLGVDPMEEMVKVWNYERSFTPVPLILGEKIYGKYRWTITDHQHQFNHYDKYGNVIMATVKVNLLEYLNV